MIEFARPWHLPTSSNYGWHHFINLGSSSIPGTFESRNHVQPASFLNHKFHFLNSYFLKLWLKSNRSWSIIVKSIGQFRFYNCPVSYIYPNFEY